MVEQTEILKNTTPMRRRQSTAVSVGLSSVATSWPNMLISPLVGFQRHQHEAKQRRLAGPDGSPSGTETNAVRC
jgi:hypothetical protein